MVCMHINGLVTGKVGFGQKLILSNKYVVIQKSREEKKTKLAKVLKSKTKKGIEEELGEMKKNIKNILFIFYNI